MNADDPVFDSSVLDNKKGEILLVLPAGEEVDIEVRAGLLFEDLVKEIICESSGSHPIVSIVSMKYQGCHFVSPFAMNQR